MQKIILLLILFIGFTECRYKVHKNYLQLKKDDSGNVFRNEQGLTIQDTSMYDRTFIEGLSLYKKPLQLVNNFLIADMDTVRFPEVLPYRSEVTLSAEKQTKVFRLSVTRLNLTTIEYQFRLTDDKISLVDRSGTAVLSSSFFLGSEMDRDQASGESYESYEYWDRQGDCWISIRIGSSRTDQGQIRAKLKQACPSGTQISLDLKTCPTLLSE